MILDPTVGALLDRAPAQTRGFLCRPCTPPTSAPLPHTLRCARQKDGSDMRHLTVRWLGLAWSGVGDISRCQPPGLSASRRGSGPTLPASSRAARSAICRLRSTGRQLRSGSGTLDPNLIRTVTYFRVDKFPNFPERVLAPFRPPCSMPCAGLHFIFGCELMLVGWGLLTPT